MASMDAASNARLRAFAHPTRAVGPLFRLLPDGGATFFGEDEIGDILEGLGLAGVRTKSVGTMQWVRARRP